MSAMEEDKAQRKQAKHKCAFFWFKDDGAAMKAMRTAKSIQPIPISAETSRLQVTGHGSSPTNGCWRQENLQITRYRPRSYGGLSFLSLAAQTPKSPHRQTESTKLRRLGSVVSFAGGGGRGQNPAQTSQRQARILPVQRRWRREESEGNGKVNATNSHQRSN